MEEDQVTALHTKNPEKIRSVLKKFNEKNAALFDFSDFNNSDKWITIWRSIFDHLKDPELESVYFLCLNTVRILTRNDLSIQNNNILDDFNYLLKLADLGPEDTTTKPTVPNSPEIITETLKCLCNIVFQSTECRQLCIKNTCCDRILRRVTTSFSESYEIGLHDLKLLFLITALEPVALTRVQIDLNGQVYLTHLLDQAVQIEAYSDQQMDLICEDLKVLFNLTSSEAGASNEREIEHRHLTSVLRNLIIRFGSMANDKEQNVVTHAINLLTNISSACLSELMVKCDINAKESVEIFPFEGWNVRVLEILIRYTKDLLNQNDYKILKLTGEKISPILTVLVKCVQCHRTMRHFIRSEVLPPLKDVSLPPEHGHELRNHLCRFLTCPEMIVRDLAAELLFVCCKENVGRMIKYTGYGNAAGLFAGRGLLDCRGNKNEEYSSDSEDSDTEEYKRVQENVNPVIGCYEPPRPDPFAGMSEEQKEYEAMQLVKLMDKLQRTRIVQPCRIGEDGKPQPVDHILQLQEELPQQQFEQKPKC